MFASAGTELVPGMPAANLDVSGRHSGTVVPSVTSAWSTAARTELSPFAPNTLTYTVPASSGGVTTVSVSVPRRLPVATMGSPSNVEAAPVNSVCTCVVPSGVITGSGVGVPALCPLGGTSGTIVELWLRP